MIDSVFILSGLGEVLIEKHYRHGASRASVADLFWAALSSSHNEDEDYDELCPVVQLKTGPNEPPRYAIHIKRGDLTFVTTLTQEISPLLVIEFLNRLVAVLTDYLGTPDEVKVKDAFSTVYQILDEMLDGGFPLVTESNALKGMIAPPTVANKVRAVVMGGVNASSLNPKLPFGAVGASPWRADNAVVYLQNEIFVDIEEYIDCLVVDSNSGGSMPTIRGVIRVTSRLSAMPEVIMSFDNPDAVLRDVCFHPCVRIERWERERVLSFLPPDGVFELMSYTPLENASRSVLDLVPFYCRPSVSVSTANSGDSAALQAGRIEVVVGPKKSSHFSSSSAPGSSIENVVVRLPLPSKTKFIDIKPPQEGKAALLDRTCVWTLPAKLDASMSACRLMGSFSLEAGGSLNSLPPCNFDFTMQVPRTISGLKISNLEIVNQSYKYFKGVKTLIKSGEFHVKM